MLVLSTNYIWLPVLIFKLMHMLIKFFRKNYNRGAFTFQLLFKSYVIDFKCKVKGCCPCVFHEGIQGSRGIFHSFLIVVSALHPGCFTLCRQDRSALYSMNRDCVGCRTGLSALEKNISCLCQKLKHNSLVFQPSLVIIETENCRPPCVNAFCNTADKYYKEGCTVAVRQLGCTLAVKYEQMQNNNFGAEWSLGGRNSKWSYKLQCGQSSNFVQTEIQFEAGRVTFYKTDNLFSFKQCEQQAVKHYGSFKSSHMLLCCNDKWPKNIKSWITYHCRGAWGSIVVKALRYQSDGPGIDPQWCHLGFFRGSFSQNHVP